MVDLLKKVYEGLVRQKKKYKARCIKLMIFSYKYGYEKEACLLFYFQKRSSKRYIKFLNYVDKVFESSDLEETR
jgi:hypothetical protein